MTRFLSPSGPAAKAATRISANYGTAKLDCSYGAGHAKLFYFGPSSRIRRSRTYAGCRERRMCVGVVMRAGLAVRSGDRGVREFASVIYSSIVRVLGRSKTSKI